MDSGLCLASTSYLPSPIRLSREGAAPIRDIRGMDIFLIKDYYRGEVKIPLLKLVTFCRKTSNACWWS